MQYQSLIRLLAYFGIDPDTLDTGKIKKILSVEFSLSETGIISINGFDYVKNDVFRELEAKNVAQIIRYHQWIWVNPSLLQCLEQGTVDFRTVSSWFEMKPNHGFVNFLSPYFSESFNKIMRNYLVDMNFGEAVRWMQMGIFIAGADDESQAYSSMRSFLMEMVKELKNVNEVTYTSLIPRLKCWTSHDAADLLNRLPDSLYDVKCDLVNAFINFTVLIQTKNHRLCFDISSMLYELINLRPEVQQLISENHRIYRENRDKSGGNGCSSTWTILILIFIAFRIIFTCSSLLPHNDYSKFTPVESDSLLLRWDSIMRLHKQNTPLIQK